MAEEFKEKLSNLQCSDGSFEELLLEYILWKSSELDKSPEVRVHWKNSSAELRILVLGCGNSQLSEYLYYHGFVNITNVDYSKEAIMDMTDLKFLSESFDAVVDKGELDTLMDVVFGPKAGNLYLTEVKRVLTDGGKFFCFSYAEPHVMDLLYNKFRIGWNMRIHFVPPVTFHTAMQHFMVVLEKEDPDFVSDIYSFLDGYTIEFYGDKALDFCEALEKEQKIRKDFSITDVLYTLEDLRLGAKGDISQVVPGRRIRLILGEPGVSSFSYYGVLLDAKPDLGEITFGYSVFVVPKLRNRDELYKTEDGQWVISANSKSTRLLLVLLDSSNCIASFHNIQIDLAPLAKQLTPSNIDFDEEIWFLHEDEVNRKKVYEAAYDLTGPSVVEDVMYNDDILKNAENRHLLYHRFESMFKSEACLSIKATVGTKKETKQEESVETVKEAKHEASSSDEVDADEIIIPLSYHREILLGILIISSRSLLTIPHRPAKAVILGLGEGVLPMYLKKNLPPTLEIMVFELDPKAVDLARRYYGFREDGNLKLHISDGIEAIKNLTAIERGNWCRTDILVVDVDSFNEGSSLSCPGEGYVENSFLSSAKESLTEDGMLIMNLVVMNPHIKKQVYSRLEEVFCSIFHVKITNCQSEVIFAMKKEVSLEELMQNSEACIELATSMGFSHGLDFTQVVKRIN